MEKIVDVNNYKKIHTINRCLVKLMAIAETSVKRKNYNNALSALSSYCQIQYSINQIYSDSKAEELILQISGKLVDVPEDYCGLNNTVLFYDGFGLDLRGWAASYAKALSSLDVNIIYVAPLKSKNEIPHIECEIEKGKGRVEFVDTCTSYTRWVTELNSIFCRYKPQIAFFYTTPNDVSGATVFNSYKGKVKRIQIDLTDHAFWIGCNAFDYAIESRLLGASNLVFHRGFSIAKVLKTDCCPYINRDINEEPLPFDIEKEPYIFSGGSLYKTFGDSELLYYKILESILYKHQSIKFLYAGSGDESELMKLKAKYPQRVFFIAERPDYFRLFEKCIFFLNTYPMFGGLMMRYAALAGKIPLTLKHKSDSDGILYDQNKLGIEFESYKEVIEEANKLIIDEDYRYHKEQLLSNSVMTEKRFADNVNRIIKSSKTDCVFEDIKEIDTTEFRQEYIERIDPNKLIMDNISFRQNHSYIWRFPHIFMRKIIGRLKHDRL